MPSVVAAMCVVALLAAISAGFCFVIPCVVAVGWEVSHDALDRALKRMLRSGLVARHEVWHVGSDPFGSDASEWLGRAR
eukprot:2938168-Rhodomonas_salina.2